jgi:sugar phosphate isomerase/epimerase
MRLSIVTDSLGFLPFERMLDQVASLGFEGIELGCGNWSSAPHLDLDGLLESAAARESWTAAIRRRGLSIEALNCSGNQLAPNEEGELHRLVVEKTFKLAGLLGVRKVVMMSGLPGGGTGERVPNWITTSWPPRNAEILDWQWNEVAIPYWRGAVRSARENGIERIALENHGCQLVYNASTALRLRDAVGDAVGMNLDPSHLFWMGGDAIAAARALGPAIYHIHAKDVRIEGAIAAVDGVLDTRTVDRYASRAWNYVALGYGHDARWWKEFIAVARMAGYDGAVSLEMEDVSMDPLTGIRKSLQVLREAWPSTI